MKVVKQRIHELIDWLFGRLVERGIAAARRRGRNRDGYVIIGVPCQGSLGDAALVASAVGHTPGRNLLVVRDRGDLPFDPAEIAGLDVLEAPQLFYNKRLGLFADIGRVARAIGESRGVLVIGADVMDGHYSHRASVRRFQLVHAAGKAGLQSRVFGFSWNEKPDPRAKAWMARASRSSALIARDPVSARRLRADGAQMVTEAADLAFMVDVGQARESDATRWIDARRAAGRRILLVNLNSLLARRIDQVGIMTRVGRDWIDAGCSLVLVPHDPRNNPSDIELCAHVAEALESPEVWSGGLPSSLPDVLGMAARGDVAVSARMHLAIFSLLNRVPVCVVAYQGKAQGLLSLFGLDPLCVTMGADTEQQLRDAVRLALDSREAFEAAITEALPQVREAAARNFAGL